MMHPRRRRGTAGAARATILLFLGLTAGALLSGCNAGVAGVALAFLLDDDDDDGRGTGGATGVEVRILRVDNHRLDPAETTVTFRLVAPRATTVGAEVRFAPEDGAEQPATLTARGSGTVSGPGALQDLAASAGGTVHQVRWDAVTDLGDASLRRVTLRVTTGTAEDAIDVFVGNDPPELLDLAFEALGQGDVEVAFRAEDSSDDLVDVELLWQTSEGADPQPGSTAGVTQALRTAEGTQHTFTWRSAADLGLADRDVLVTVRLRDRLEGEPGATTEETREVFLDNNEAPFARLLGGTYLDDGDLRRGQAIEFVLEDAESDPVDVIVQWAAPGRDFPALPAGLDADAEMRETLLEDDALRRELQVATLAPQTLEGPVEAPGPGGPDLAADEVLATWLRRDGALQGLRGRSEPRRQGTVPAATIDGHRVELVRAGGGTEERLVCSYEPGSGVLRLDGPLDPVPAPGDLLRIRIDGSTGLASAPGGLRHRRVWQSDADLPGGGPARIRVVPFDRAAAVAPSGHVLCNASIVFPSEGALPGDRGTAASLGEAKPLAGPFGLRRGPETALSPEEVPAAAVVRDVDADGRSDVVLATRDERSVVLLLQTAPGLFDVLRLRDARLPDPRGVVAEDLDGDGDVDVAVAGTESPRVAVFLQEPELDFIAERRFLEDPGLAEPSGLVAADVDDDGDTDLVVSDAGDDTSPVVVFRRGGGPEPECSPEVDGWAACPVGSPASARDVQVADLEDDGDLDFVTTAPSGFTLILEEDDGRTVQAIAAPGADLRALAVDDLDGDGAPDLAAGDVATGRIVAALRRGPRDYEVETLGDALLFTRPVDIASGSRGLGGGDGILAVADAGGAMAGEEPGLGICVSSPSGSRSCDILSREAPDGGLEPAPRAVALGDLDGDGRTDVVSAAAGASGVAVWLQSGPGDFAAPEEIVAEAPVVEGARAPVAADVDGDGRPDLVTLSVTRGDLTVLFQDEDGTFADLRVEPDGTGQSLGPLDVVAGDVDGDGRPDLVTADVDSDTVTVHWRNGGTAFPERTVLTAEGLMAPESVAVADLDGDGRLDVVTAGRIGGGVVWFPQVDARSFDAARTIAGGDAVDGPLSLVARDLDGDGRPDVAAGGHRDGLVHVWWQTEVRGEFSAGSPVELPAGAAPVELQAADLDDDGDGDVVVASLGETPLSVLRQTAPRTFSRTDPATGLEDAAVTSVTVGDLDGDGRPDIALTDADETDPTVRVILAGPSGEFDDAPPVALRTEGAEAPVGVVAVDVDGDGENDLVVADRAGDRLGVFRGGR